MVVTKARIDEAALRIEHHLCIERSAERLRDTALDLAAALHRIGDAAGVARLHALQDLDLAGRLVHRDPKALHIEGNRTRRAGGRAAGGEFLALATRRPCQPRERHADAAA